LIFIVEDDHEKWGFHLDDIKEALKDTEIEKMISKRITVKFFTEV
jgi:hypothetical protein